MYLIFEYFVVMRFGGSKKMRFVGKKALFGPEIVVSNSVDYRQLVYLNLTAYIPLTTTTAFLCGTVLKHLAGTTTLRIL